MFRAIPGAFHGNISMRRYGLDLSYSSSRSDHRSDRNDSGSG